MTTPLRPSPAAATVGTRENRNKMSAPLAEAGPRLEDARVPKVSVIVPCLNEAANVPVLLDRVRPLLDTLDAELVVVDDGSTDDSLDVLERHSPGARLVIRRHARNEGIPQAWSTGLSAASGEWIASLDADLQYAPEELGLLLELAERNQLDFVQGARRRVESEGPLRHLLSRGLNTALNVTFRTKALDHKSAFFVCRREAFAKLLTHRHHFRHWQCFIGVSARALGLRCGEQLVSFRPRERGSSAFGAIPWRSTLEVMADFVPALRLYGRRLG